MLTLKKQGHFQIACMSVFKATHPKEGLQGGLQHPNQYFEESQAILNGTDSTENPSELLKWLIELSAKAIHEIESKQLLLYKINLHSRFLSKQLWKLSAQL